MSCAFVISFEISVALHTLSDVAFDEQLAQRVRALLDGQPDVAERRMFGGIAFLVAGNMCCGVMRDDLIVRLDRDTADQLLESDPGVREFDFTGRPMRGWLFVAPEAVAEDADLAAWVDRAARSPRACRRSNRQQSSRISRLNSELPDFRG